MSSTNSPDELMTCSDQTVAVNIDPFASMRSIRATLRQDLQITRTTNRGAAIYVVFDSVSFQSHRLTLDDYGVVARLSSDRSLGECFEACVRDGILQRESEAEFYGFVDQLGARNLLTTQTQSPTLLYDRFVHSKKAAWKNTVLGFLFLTIPLSNPDKFLDRTIGRFRFLFSMPVFVTWAIGMLFSLSIIVTRWDLFWEPLNSLLAVKNLLFLGVAFVGLKVWHELGHGYACKLFGGRIPEMGCKLIVGMPLAYVDASAAWSFPRRRDRLIVMLGGMYFELLLVVPATILWACWPHTMIGSFAYQLIVMAGIATLLFNINPLMKFDGYFILSDLLGITNLRTRSIQEIKRQLKTYVLDVPSLPSSARDSREQTILIAYGIAAIAYGWVLMITIAGLIATRLYVVGMILAAFQLGTPLYRGAKELYLYLWYDEQLASVRPRAKQVGWGLAIGVPILVAFFPVLSSQYVDGVVTAVKSTPLRVATPGFVEAIIDPVPDLVAEGQTLVRMRNIDVETLISEARLSEDAARRAMHVVSQGNAADEARQLQVAINAVANRAVAEKTHDEMTLRAPHDGRLASVLPRQRIGTYMQTGEVIANIAQGTTQVRAWLNEEQLATSRLKVGSKVSVKIANDRTRTYVGTIRSVAPANKSKFEDISLTTVGEGAIPYDPNTGETLEQVFQLLVDIPELDSQQTLQGLSASVRLVRRYESVGRWAVRQTSKFVNSLFANAH